MEPYSNPRTLRKLRRQEKRRRHHYDSPWYFRNFPTQQRRRIREIVSWKTVLERLEDVYRERSTGRLIGHCLWHVDVNPSLSFEVTGERRGYFRCWSCGMHGDIVDYVAYRLGLRSVSSVKTALTGMDGISFIHPPE